LARLVHRNRRHPLPARLKVAVAEVTEAAVEAAAETEEAAAVVAVEVEPMLRQPNPLPEDRTESPC
jgi:hypothetical protein